MPVRVSLSFVVVFATILLTQAQIRYVRENLQTYANGYEGCWRTFFGDRVFRHEIGRGVRSIQECAVRCAGYEVFGLEDGDLCFCDSSLLYVLIGHDVALERECNRLCRQPYNNIYWICGGANRISVFSTEQHITYMEQFSDEPLRNLINARRHLQTIENGYFGCWMDNVRNRVLRYQVGREVRNIQDCAVWCMEYRLFGIEDEDQCYCDNQLFVSLSRQPLHANECDTLCRHPWNNGTETWICGGANRISVFVTEDHITYMEQFPDEPLWKLLYARRHLQTMENGYYGCWLDDTDNRVLRHEIGRGVRNVQGCALWCEGYVYFGMEDEDQCFCGNELFVTNRYVQERLNEDACDTFCRHPWYNNTDWICGGAMGISVYKTEEHLTSMQQFTDVPLWKLFYARRHLQTWENGYDGCWKDDSDNSVLSSQQTIRVGNLQDCARLCLGSTFFGVEDTDRCFCGHDLLYELSSRERVGDADCDDLCREQGYNNTEWICGAANRISVYVTIAHLYLMDQFIDEPRSLVDRHVEIYQFQVFGN